MAGPHGSPLDVVESRTVGQDHHQRHAAQAFQQEPQQVERRTVGPVHVVEDDQGRPALRGGLEELPQAGEHLALLLLVGHRHDGRRAGHTQQGTDQRTDILVHLQRGHQ